MNAIVVSDLHIGSRYFLHHDFENFLGNIPEDCELILNGDIIDNPNKKLQPSHKRILNLIEHVSHRQKVIWVRGNHDDGYTQNGFKQIHFKTYYTIEKRYLIVHGYDFDKIMPRSQVFIKSFKLIHDIMIKFGSRPVHVANYAKKFELLYKVLRDNVMKNAVNCALENGYEAVICGHTHYPEDRVYNGIRYMNTGAWTETPAFYLQMIGNEMTLNPIVS
ncbi:MAG: UDP-2,3-diacylglucosamine diphosphatase [Deltaproteobacteria bacterium]|nr:UDP-2,3-diacylglucosamine diphosphatase [Deltaproteobacteria bacterium]